MRITISKILSVFLIVLLSTSCANDLHITMPQGPKGEDGKDGKNLYEIWKEIPGNENGSKEDFFSTLKGEKGENGKTGDSSYDVWKKVIEEQKDSSKISIRNEKGEKWLADRDGDQLEDYFRWLKGKDGLSVYEYWKERNPNGTEADFEEWLQGKDGQNGSGGTNGEDALSAFEIWKIVTGNKDATEEDFLNWLKGSSGLDGTNGKSVFEIWKEKNPNGTETDFEEWIQGEDGLNGLNGKSAFEIWKELLGNSESTYQDYLDWMRGDNGKSAYHIWKEAVNNPNIKVYNNDGTEYNIDLGDSREAYFNWLRGKDGLNGKSAYDIWIESIEKGIIKDKLGNTYTKEMGITTSDFLDWLKGSDGTNGEDGKDAEIDDKLSVIVNYWWDQAMKDPSQKEKLEDKLNDIIEKNGVDKDEAKNIIFLEHHSKCNCEDLLTSYINVTVTNSNINNYTIELDKKGNINTDYNSMIIINGPVGTKYKIEFGNIDQLDKSTADKLNTISNGILDNTIKAISVPRQLIDLNVDVHVTTASGSSKVFSDERINAIEYIPFHIKYNEDGEIPSSDKPLSYKIEVIINKKYIPSNHNFKEYPITLGNLKPSKIIENIPENYIAIFEYDIPENIVQRTLSITHPTSKNTSIYTFNLAPQPKVPAKLELIKDLTEYPQCEKGFTHFYIKATTIKDAEFNLMINYKDAEPEVINQDNDCVQRLTDILAQQQVYIIEVPKTYKGTKASFEMNFSKQDYTLNSISMTPSEELSKYTTLQSVFEIDHVGDNNPQMAKTAIKLTNLVEDKGYKLKISLNYVSKLGVANRFEPNINEIEINDSERVIEIYKGISKTNGSNYQSLEVTKVEMYKNDKLEYVLDQKLKQLNKEIGIPVQTDIKTESTFNNVEYAINLNVFEAYPRSLVTITLSANSDLDKLNITNNAICNEEGDWHTVIRTRDIQESKLSLWKKYLEIIESDSERIRVTYTIKVPNNDISITKSETFITK